MVQQIRPRELDEKIHAGQKLYFLDVREPWEHDTAHLEKSILIPLRELLERLDEIEPPEDALVVVYCHHGIRSLSGAAILESAGITPVVSLSGGIDRWSREVDASVPRY